MVRIVTDSNADITLELARQIGVDEIVSTFVIFGDKSFKSSEMTPADFHARLKSDPNFPKTSQPSVGDFVSLYEKYPNDEIVVILISKHLSGTFASAESAVLTTGVESRVTLIDTQQASASEAVLVLEALRLAKAGATPAQIKAHVESLIPRAHLIFVLETLENLKRGGRIGGASAFIGGVLQMKPILTIKDGKIEPVERVRTSGKAVARLKDILLQDLKGKPDPKLCIMHAAAPELGRQLADDLAKELGIPTPMVLEAGPAIATHTGPGAVGVGYIA